MSRLPRIEEIPVVVTRAREYLQCKSIIKHLLRLPTEFRYLEQLIHGQETFNEDET